MEKSSRVEKRVSSLFERFGLVFGIVLTLTALVIGLLSYFTLEQKTEVAAQVLACDELTTYHPELEAEFIYAGEEVMHLWKLKVNFVNSGDKTIVGVGNQKNIFGEGLNFEFPDNTRILRVEKEAETFQSNVTQVKPNHFQIQFSQWRSGEYNVISFCVASDKPLDAAPFPEVTTRDIIDGDVVVQDLTERRPEERMFLIDRLPRPISTPGKVIGGILAGALAILLLIVVPWGWKDSLPIIRWKRRHFSSFVESLDRFEPPLSDEDKQKLKKDPSFWPTILLPEQFWAKFEGPKPPTKSAMFGNAAAGIAVTLILLACAFGFISLTLLLIPV